MQILTIGDPHFKKNNVLESEEMVNKLVDLAVKRKPKFIVVLGDVLHRHETINVFPLNRAEEMILKLSKISPTFVLVGNHDRPNNSNYLTDEHPFNALKHWNNTYIVDKVLDAVIGSYRFLFVPYVPPGKFMDALSTVENPLDNTCMIFAHQEFYGAKMGAIVSKSGDTWDLENPLVVSGHIHDYDHLQPNIIYTGTPMQHSFGDKDTKGVSIFTIDTNGKWSQERISLGLKKKIIQYITPKEIHTYQPPENVLIKLKVRGEESEIKAALKLNRVKELKNLGIVVVFEITKSLEPKEIKNTCRVSYYDRLYSEISDDKKCVEWLHKIKE